MSLKGLLTINLQRSLFSNRFACGRKVVVVRDWGSYWLGSESTTTYPIPLGHNFLTREQD